MDRNLVLATIVVLVLLVCAACACLAPSAFWAGVGAVGVCIGYVSLCPDIRANLKAKGNRDYMETTGGYQKNTGVSLFARLAKSKTALQRSKVFLEKKAYRTSGVKGFGATAVAVVLSGRSDAEILAALREKWRAACGQPSKAPNAGRADSRLTEAAKFFAPEKEIATTEGPGYLYIDVGSSEGSITEAVAAELGLSRGQAIAVDIVPQKDNPHFTFIQINAECLPFADAMFDLITMFMSAHHFADAPCMFAEAARIAKPGARLILREHGTFDKTSPLFYDLVHAYYEVIAGDESTPEEFAARYAKGDFATYRRVDAWSQLLLDAGFKETDMLVIKDTFDTLLTRYVRI